MNALMTKIAHTEMEKQAFFGISNRSKMNRVLAGKNKSATGLKGYRHSRSFGGTRRQALGAAKEDVKRTATKALKSSKPGKYYQASRAMGGSKTQALQRGVRQGLAEPAAGKAKALGSKAVGGLASAGSKLKSGLGGIGNKLRNMSSAGKMRTALA